MKPNPSNRFSAELRRDIRTWQASLRHVESHNPTIWMINGPPHSLPETAPIGRGLAIAEVDHDDEGASPSGDPAEQETRVA